jgi:hypothetical protein
VGVAATVVVPVARVLPIDVVVFIGVVAVYMRVTVAHGIGLGAEPIGGGAEQRAVIGVTVVDVLEVRAAVQSGGLFFTSCQPTDECDCAHCDCSTHQYRADDPHALRMATACDGQVSTM